MSLWIRFEHAGLTKIGTLDGETIAVHAGSMFETPRATGEIVGLSEVSLKYPCEPSKMLGLWNNFHALAKKINSPIPAEPLYFIKKPRLLRRPPGPAFIAPSPMTERSSTRANSGS